MLFRPIQTSEKLLLQLLSSLSLLLIAVAVELPQGVEENYKNDETVTPAEEEDGIAKERTEVSVLCYHDFSEELGATEMRIKAAAFSDQMQQLADSGINVISLSEFEQWKSGKKQLPARNVLITIDDGWRSVYEVAFPVLKKHGFPFALGLYTDFINIGGKSLKAEMINEMRRSGMEIACHSASHPLPSKFKAARNAGIDQYAAFLDKEIKQSKLNLDRRFQITANTYIYPGGFYFQDMFPAILNAKMNYAFTVKPGKITLESNNLELPRYVVLGTTDRMFAAALRFEGSNKLVKKLAYPVKPSPQSVTSERLPWIGIDLSSVEDIDRDSVYMRVAGFGKVKAGFIKGTNRFEWRASRSLRLPSYKVLVQWKEKGSSKYQDPVKWEFFVDHKPEYLRLSEKK